MPGLPMMPWFPRDFLAATRGWPLIAKAVYRELLDAQWDMGTLAIATPLLQQMSGATVAEFEIAWVFVEPKFPVVEGGRQNPTLEMHRQKALQLKEIRAKSGKKGGLSKALAIASQLPSTCSSQAVAKPYHPSPSPSPSPSETSQSLVSEETRVRAPSAVDRVFDHWRATWNHPKAALDPKRRALITRALKSYSADDLCASISGYLNSPHHTGQNDRNTVYDSLELLLRDAGKIDAGLAFLTRPPTHQSELTNHNIAAATVWRAPEDHHAANGRGSIQGNHGDARRGLRQETVAADDHDLLGSLAPARHRTG